MKIAVLGLGSIGARHLGNLHSLGHNVMGYDTEPHRMSALNRDGVHTDRKGLLIWADAIIIATPSDQHLDDLGSALSYRKPALVEKPIYTREAEAIDKLLQLAERDRIPIFVGYNLRFHPCVVQAREWVDGGAIGRVLYASFICGQLNTKYKDDLVLNWSHEIDLACHLLGKAELVVAECSNDPILTTVASIAILLRHKYACNSAVHLNYLSEPQARGFVIVGAEGSIEVNLAHAAAVLHNKKGTDPHYFRPNAFDRSYQDEARSFIKAVNGVSTQLATGRDGLDVMRLCMAARGVL